MKTICTSCGGKAAQYMTDNVSHYKYCPDCGTEEQVCEQAEEEEQFAKILGSNYFKLWFKAYNMGKTARLSGAFRSNWSPGEEYQAVGVKMLEVYKSAWELGWDN